MILRTSLVLAALLLVACDSGEPGKMSLSEYEGPEGEAMVRHLITHLPPVDPGVPKVFTVVKGASLESTKTAFVKRFDDMKLPFISGEVLGMRGAEKMPIDPRSGLSPVTLQLAEIKRSGGETFDVVAGWAYKKVWERRHYKLAKTATGYEVTKDERLEGNYVPDSTPARDRDSP